MPLRIRTLLARELVSCARMIVTASIQEARTDRIAKLIVAYPSEDIKNLVYRIDPSIIKYIRKFGVRRNFSDSGYVLHHMTYPENRGVIYSTISNDEIKEIRQAVQTYENTKIKTDKYKEIEEEVKDIVLLPAWFHDKYHTYGKEKWKLMTTRAAYYKKMGELLKSDDIFDPESKEYIDALNFDNTSIHSALQCLTRLSTTVPKDYRETIVDLLEEDFDEMRETIKNYYNHHTF